MTITDIPNLDLPSHWCWKYFMRLRLLPMDIEHPGFIDMSACAFLYDQFAFCVSIQTGHDTWLQLWCVERRAQWLFKMIMNKWLVKDFSKQNRHQYFESVKLVPLKWTGNQVETKRPLARHQGGIRRTCLIDLHLGRWGSSVLVLFVEQRDNQ